MSAKPMKLPHSAHLPNWNFSQGEVLLIDKPLRWTSFDVVKKIKHQVKAKVGHAGTLDPLATGLLILCTGKMTKQIEQFQAQEKEYTGTLMIGKTTPSIDLETDFDSEQATNHLTVAQVEEAMKSFVGEIQQVPPQHSAIKVDGARAYKKARQGKAVVLKSRTVTISSLEITQANLPTVDFRMVCSKGTYVRSLVRDVGQQLGVGAYLAQLCRTRIGDHRLEDAYSLDEFLSLVKASAV